MVCTFGDITDVTWWRELSLPVRGDHSAERDARARELGSAQWDSLDASGRRTATTDSLGCQQRRLERGSSNCFESGELVGDPRPITHPVKFFEKGDRPLEIITSRQWFIKAIAFREALIKRGKGVEMASRVHGDALRELDQRPERRLVREPAALLRRAVSRVVSDRAEGHVDYEHPIFARDDSCRSIRPQTFRRLHGSQRGQPDGFIGDPDVMDTWATSSLSPQIVCGWPDDLDLFARTFPMDLRPQAHDIIRTWLFDSVLRAHLENDSLPWANAAISGWILDPDRKKMSKSKGNVVTPLALLEEHGSDGVRYWAASGRPGTDTAFDPGQMKVGRRLAIKILNASKFALMNSALASPKPGAKRRGALQASASAITFPVDRAMLRNLATLVREVTDAFEAYDYARVLQRTESVLLGLLRRLSRAGEGPPGTVNRAGRRPHPRMRR